MPNNVPVLAIDGPSGSGKGTIGQLLSQHLEWHFLDSGALYRAVGYLAVRYGVRSDDIPGLARLALNLNIRFEVFSDETAAVWADDEEIGHELRTEEAGKMAS